MFLMLFLTLSWNIASFSQPMNAKIKLPKIIPPSPEVAQLAKVGNVSAGLHTGSANLSIPLHTINAGNIKWNIAISYVSNGIKVDEIPTRVGLGWNLVAGGVVSRVIHDDPDGTAPYLTPPSNMYAQNAEMLQYLKNASTLLYDTEWDEYSYSFNGISGKFFLNSNGDGYCIPHNNMKVKVFGFETSTKTIQITSGEGTVYSFGYGSIEKTRSVQAHGGDGEGVSASGPHETAWFLTEVKNADGDKIVFNYSPIFFGATISPYQTMIKPYISQPNCGETSSCNYSVQTGTNKITYDSYYLTNISADDGTKIDFTYDPLQDPSSDKDNQLKKITVSSSGAYFNSGTLKKYKFFYYKPSFANSVPNYRFFLTELRTVDPLVADEDNVANYIAHKFEYIEMDNMVPRLSYNQDYFGYSNGQTNSYFVPQTPSYNGQVINPLLGGNRSADPTGLYQQKGLVKKITYPQGGYEELKKCKCKNAKLDACRLYESYLLSFFLHF